MFSPEMRGKRRAAGRRSGDAVSRPVARFNAEGTAALVPRHGGGPTPAYAQAARGRILREVQRPPTPEADEPRSEPAPERAGARASRRRGRGVVD